MADGPVRIRLLPLDGRAYEYGGRAEEVPVIEALLGGTVERQAGGDVIITCPAPRKAGHAGVARRAVLRPGMVVARFSGEPFRFIVTDAAAFAFMSEPSGEAREGL
jgi:hypothetical protein